VRFQNNGLPVGRRWPSSFCTRVILILLTLLTAGAIPAAAQSPLATFGVKGGLTISTASIELPEVEQQFGFVIDPDIRTGMLAGVFFGGPISGSIGWQGEFLVAQKGLKFDFFGNDEDVRLTYIEIPALVQWTAPISGRTVAHVSAGPSFGFRVSEVQKENGVELDEELQADQTETFDFGIAFGGGISFDKLVIDARFTVGLVNVAKPDQLGPNSEAHNRSFALTVGWKFR
jgi:Outer membrane protein beta-barrel domain